MDDATSRELLNEAITDFLTENADFVIAAILSRGDWQDQRAGKPEGYTLDRENHHGDGSVRGISNGKG